MPISKSAGAFMSEGSKETQSSSPVKKNFFQRNGTTNLKEIMKKHGMIDKEKSGLGVGLGIQRSFGGIAGILDMAKESGVYEDHVQETAMKLNHSIYHTGASGAQKQVLMTKLATKAMAQQKFHVSNQLKIASAFKKKEDFEAED